MEVIHEREDKIFKEVWQFWLCNEFHLVLDRYYIAERLSTRHKYKTLNSYNRLDNRGSHIKIDDVPFDDSIKKQAKDILYAQINVDKTFR